MPPSSWPAMGLFLAVVAFVACAAVAGVAVVAKPEQRWRDGSIAALGVAVWMGVTAIPPWVGALSAEEPLPSMPLFFGSQTLFTLALVASPLGKRLSGLSSGWLLAFQGFRFPLELVLAAWVAEGRVPPQMTWTGSNPDILAGLAALALAPFATRHRAVAWLGWGITMALLLNVMRVVVASFPSPVQRFDEPVLLAFSVPEVWIVSMCVIGALTGELLLLRRLLSTSQG
ncbi:MAG: hypothetical protein AAGA48_32920 [Myxococcota bacterium]